MINYYKNKGEWKLQLIAEINFISLKPGSDETRIMHTRSDNIEIMIGDIIEELFKSAIKKSNKKHCKVRDHCHYAGKYRGAAHNICNLRHKIPKEIPIVFRGGSIYAYHFIIKELVKEFDGNFECLGENTEKCITFSAPVKKKIEN